jgi:hypothetical protein
MTTATGSVTRHPGAIRALASVLAWTLVLSAQGCDRVKLPAGKHEAASAEMELDPSHAVTGTMTVRTGGVLSTADSRGTRIEVELYRDSLYEDTDIELVPLSSVRLGDERTVVEGVVIRRKGSGDATEHIELVQPAEIRFHVKDAGKRNLAVVAWSEDTGSYSILPSFRVATKDGVVVSSAVSRFSGFGVRGGGGPEAKDETDAMTWSILVNDVVTKSVGPMSIRFRLWFVASWQGDPSGLTLINCRDGHYSGPATLTAKSTTVEKNDFLAAMVKIDGRLAGKVDLDVADGGESLGTGTLSVKGNLGLNALGFSNEVRDMKKNFKEKKEENSSLVLKGSDGTRVVVTVAGIGDFSGTMRAMKKKQDKCKDAKGKIPPHRQAILDRYPSVQNVQDKPFPTMKDAMKAAAGAILPACKGTDSEWGGLVCEDANGQFHVIPGGDHHCGTNFEGEIDTGAADGCPGDMQPVSSIHCHPTPTDSPKPSPGDIENMHNYNLEQTGVVVHSDGKGDRIVIQDSSGSDLQTIKLGK